MWGLKAFSVAERLFHAALPGEPREAMRKRWALGGSSSVGLIELRYWVSPSVSGDI